MRFLKQNRLGALTASGLNLVSAVPTVQTLVTFCAAWLASTAETLELSR